MKFRFRLANTTIFLSVAVLIMAAATSLSFARGKEMKEPSQSSDELGVRLRIEVIGADKPVSEASVYVRYIVKHRMGKDENVEMNIKTNPEGVAVAPPVPRGKVIVQVIAEGWKAFGQTYDATNVSDQQIIKIHLERPPKWY